MTPWEDFVRDNVFSAQRPPPATPRVDVKLLYGEDESRRRPDCWGGFVEGHNSRVSGASLLVPPKNPMIVVTKDGKLVTVDSNANVITPSCSVNLHRRA